jgi:hypothetical protein
MSGKKLGKGTEDFKVTPEGRILTPVRAMFNLTGQPPGVAAYAESDSPGTSKLQLRRPSGGKEGPGIRSISKGSKGGKQ